MLEHLKRKFFVRTTTFNPIPEVMAFNEGQRYVILTILSFLEKDQRELAKYLEQTEPQER